jgi:hypothetical protein
MTAMYAVLEHLGWTLVMLLYLFILVTIVWMLIFVLAWLAGGARRALWRRLRR